MTEPTCPAGDDGRADENPDEVSSRDAGFPDPDDFPDGDEIDSASVDEPEGGYNAAAVSPGAEGDH